MERLIIVEKNDNRLEAWIEGTSICITLGDSPECFADIKLSCKDANEFLKWLLAAQMEQHVLTVPPEFSIVPGGDHLCVGCNAPYRNHRKHDSFPWLTKLCGDDMWIKIVREHHA